MASGDREKHIAIVGMACQLPGANSVQAAWNIINSGAHAITEAPADRWAAPQRIAKQTNGKVQAFPKWGGYLDDIEQFDPKFFGISTREARLIDPQQRLLLQTSWQAIESLGMHPGDFKGSRTGVFVGISTFDYMQRQMLDTDEMNVDAYSALGAAHSIAANRLSYFYDFTGPSLAVDTACSSASVALHMARKSLLAGECDYAIVGGVNVIVSPLSTISFSKARMLAPDGRCKSFDAAADGYVRSEGCVSIVLTRADIAAEAGQKVHAYVRGSSVNQDGNTLSITTPSGAAQRRAVVDALVDADLSPADIDFVEAHGTGTKVGDKIELESLAQVFGGVSGRQNPVLVGTAKPHFGHLEAASGLVGLLKAVKSLEARQVPALPFLNDPIGDASDASLQLAAQTFAFERRDAPLRAGVSCFGFGGTNAHIILEAAEEVAEEVAFDVGGEAADVAVRVLPVASHHPEALRAVAADYLLQLRTDPGLDLEAFCAQVTRNRSRYGVRRAIRFTDRDDLMAQLEALAGDQNIAASYDGVEGLAFCFSGQGAQMADMCRDLFARDTVYRDTLLACDEIARAKGGFSLIDVMGDPDGSLINETAYAQPILFAVGLGLAKSLKARGVTPDHVMGHSLGEITAACLAGVMDMPTAMQLVLLRGKLMGAAPGDGAMLSMSAKPEILDDLLRARAQGDVLVATELDISGRNCPGNITVSGPETAIDAMLLAAKQAGAKAQKLTVSHAFHSHMMEPILADFAAGIADAEFHAPQIPIVSNVSGKLAGPDQRMDADYWVQHIRRAVEFNKGVETLLEHGVRTIVEIGPQPILSPWLRALSSGERKIALVPCLPRRMDNQAGLMQALGHIYAHGHNIDWWHAPIADVPQRHALPPYRFAKGHYWFQNGKQEHAPQADAVSSSQGAAIVAFDFNASGVVETLAQHQAGGRAIVPAALYIGLLRAAAKQLLGAGAQTPVLTLEKCRLPNMLSVAEAQDCRLVVSALEQGDASWALAVRVADASSANGRLLAHAVARKSEGAPRSVDLSTPDADLEQSLERADLYVDLEDTGLVYGPAFQGVKSVQFGAGRALGRVERRAEAQVPLQISDACMLDANLQVMGGALKSLDPVAASQLWVPVGFDKLTIFGDLPAQSMAQVGMLDGPHFPDIKSFDLSVLDDAGQQKMVFEGFVLRRMEGAQSGVNASGPLFDIDHVAHPMPPLALGDNWQSGWRVLAPNAGQIGDDILASLHDAQVVEDAQALADAQGAGPLLYVHDERSDVGTAQDRLQDFVAFLRAVATEATKDSEQSVGRLIVLFVVGDMPSRCLDGEAMRAAVRVLRNELPALKPICVQVEAGVDRAGLAAALGSALQYDDEPDQIWRDGVLSVRRLVPVSNRLPAWVPEKTSIEKMLAPGAKSGIAHLELMDLPQSDMGAEDITIVPEAAGLNFRDVLKSLRLYPNRPGLPLWLGDECVGVVSAVGSAVAAFAPGDRVMAVAPRAFATQLVAAQNSAVKVPEYLSSSDAASIPIAFSTAWYGLVELAQIKAGETVLIHAAAGGVGLAAVQIAQSRGARVIATAGSAEKRAYLETLGIETIGQSRDLSFVQTVLEATDGAGVDVVLNSLAGDAIDASIGLLKPFGRFVDIGKRDIVEGNDIGLRPFHKSLSFHALDMELLFAQAPARGQALLQDIAEAFEQKILTPLPLTVFAIEDGVEAFQYMAGAKNIGKIVLQIDRQKLVGAVAPIAQKLEKPAALITGAFGALGIELVQHLASLGMAHFVLLGRSKPRPDVAKILDRLRAEGATIFVHGVDVSDEKAMGLVLVDAAKAGLRVRHIYHAAGVLADHMVADTDDAAIARAWVPKVKGAKVLDRLSRDLELESFVCFSSVSTLLGSPGQLAYAAANAALDGLCRARADAGLAAKSVSLGPWAAGLALADAETVARFDRLGLRSFSVSDGMRVLFKALNMPGPTSVAVRFAVQQAGQPAPAISNLAICSDLYQKGSSAGSAGRAGSAILQLLVASDADARPQALAQYLSEKLAGVMAQSAADIPVDQPLEALGFDSLAGLEFAMMVEEETGAQFPMDAVGDTTSLNDIAKLLLAQIDVDAVADAEAGASAAPKAKAAEAKTVQPMMAMSQGFEPCEGSVADYISHIRPDFTRYLPALGLDMDFDHATGDILSGEVDGVRREIVDFVGGYGSCLFGHNHPAIAGAALQVLQSNRPMHAQGSARALTGRLARELSDTLGGEVGGDYAVALANSGAEAIEAALKHAVVEYAARLKKVGIDITSQEVPEGFTPVFLAIEGSYHGKTLGALSIGHFRHWPRTSSGLRVRSVPRNDVAALQAILAEERLMFGDMEVPIIAGAFVEPVQGEGGVHPLDQAFLEAMRAGADEIGFPLVFDEIQSGFYRCGHFAASSALGVGADYYTFGKSLGGGLAKISALLVRKDRYQEGFGILQSSTYAEDDFSSQAALAALRLAKSDDIGQKVLQRSAVLREKLQALAAQYEDIVHQVRGRGLMLGIELRISGAMPSGILSSAVDKDLLGQIVCSHLLARDKVRTATTMSAPNTIRLQPSAYISDAHIDALIAALGRVFRALRQRDGAYLVSHLLSETDWLHEVGDFRDGAAAVPVGAVSDIAHKVGFLIHVADDAAILRWDPSWARLSQQNRQELTDRVAPVSSPTLVRIAPITTPSGAQVEVHFMSLFASSRTIENAMRRGETQWVIDQVQQASDMAADAGCTLVGLGGFLSIVTHNGQRLSDARVGFTTGNALTIAAGLAGLNRAIDHKLKGADVRVGILGAVGNIGQTYARCLAREQGQLTLVGRAGSTGRLDALAAQIVGDAQADGRAVSEIVVADDLGALKACNVIVAATNSALPLVFPEHIGAGPTVLLDIAVPPNISPDVRAQRDDAHVLQGGLVGLPDESHMDLSAFGLPDDHLYACMAETAVLGLEGRGGNYSIGDVSIEQVAEIAELAAKHHFKMGH